MQNSNNECLPNSLPLTTGHVRTLTGTLRYLRFKLTLINGKVVNNINDNYCTDIFNYKYVECCLPMNVFHRYADKKNTVQVEFFVYTVNV